MAGTIQLWGNFGASPGTSGNLNGHLHFTDEDSISSKASTSPIQKPDSGTAYSFERYVFFKCAVAPDNQFTNFRVWSPITSSIANGIAYKVGTTNTYTDPVATKSTKAMRLFHSTYTTYATGLRLYQTLVNVNDVTNYLVIQVNITNAAESGSADSTRTIIQAAWDQS